MALRTLELTYGTARRTFTIPEDRLAGEPIAPRSSAVLPGEPAEILRQALAEPVGRAPLRSLVDGRRVAIVISDEFRAGQQHAILDALLEEVFAGSPELVRVLCATGTHDPAVYAKNAGLWVEEARALFGREIEFEAHHSEAAQFAELGISSRGTRLRLNTGLLDCDVRVYGHESKHHYLNGYSCVDKQIVPGLSCGTTVAMNHKLALHPDSGAGRNAWHSRPERRANPFSADTRECRELSERMVLAPDGRARPGEVVTFALDMVSEGRSIYWVRAGDPSRLMPEMIEVVDRLMAFEVTPSRYVVLSPGGPPASQALYGTQNSFDLALKGALLPGGEALVIAPLEGRPDLPPDVRGLAPDRRSKELFWDNLVRLLPLPLAEARAEIDRNFELYLWKTDRMLRQLVGDRVTLYLHSELPASTLAAGGLRTAPDIQAWIDERVAHGDGQFTVIDNGNKLCVTSRD